jgi:hypothetical protein
MLLPLPGNVPANDLQNSDREPSSGYVWVPAVSQPE